MGRSCQVALIGVQTIRMDALQSRESCQTGLTTGWLSQCLSQN